MLVLLLSIFGFCALIIAALVVPKSMAAKRLFLAFLLAPLWVPLLAALLYAITEPGSQMVGTVGFAVAGFLYGSVIVLGIPLLFLLRKYGWTSMGASILAGIGVTWFALTLMIAYAIGSQPTVEHAFWYRIYLSPRAFACYGIVAIIGATVGMAFWFIARPDRFFAPRQRLRATLEVF